MQVAALSLGSVVPLLSAPCGCPFLSEPLGPEQNANTIRMRSAPWENYKAAAIRQTLQHGAEKVAAVAEGAVFWAEALEEIK